MDLNDVFTPVVTDVEQAQKIVAAIKESKGNVCVVDGRMVDRPVVRAAQRTLAIANKAAHQTS